MSLFSWLFCIPSRVNTALARNQKVVPRKALVHQEPRDRRHTRREQLYLAVRDAMTRSGVLASRFKFRVLCLDADADTFLVMVDLAPQDGGQAEDLLAIEQQIMRDAMVRFDIAVSCVYWRRSGTALAPQPKPHFEKTIESERQVDGLVQAMPVYKTIERDELAAFRDARRTDPAASCFVLPPKKAARGKASRKASSARPEFEDTQLMEPAALPGLSATQYGDIY